MTIASLSDHQPSQQSSSPIKVGVGKLANFLSISEHTKERLRSSSQKEKSYVSRTERGKKKNERNNRKSSIFGSLEKFLLDDSEETECTSVTQQSSYSSGLSSLESLSLANGKHPQHLQMNMPEPVTEEDEYYQQRAPLRQKRPQRRGSVTKFSLETTRSASSSDDDNDFQDCQTDDHLQQQKNKRLSASNKLPPSGPSAASRRRSSTSTTASRDPHMFADDDCSVNTIDQLPVPVRAVGASLRSFSHHDEEDDEGSNGALVDTIPLPMKGFKERRGSTLSVTSAISFDSASAYGEEEDNSESHHSELCSPVAMRGRRPSNECIGDTGGNQASWDDQCSVASERTSRSCKRRGSVTKYSLDNALSSLPRDSHDDYNSHQYSDDRSTISEQLPPRPRPRRIINPLKNLSRPPRTEAGAGKRRTTSLTGLLNSLPGKHTSTSHADQDDQSVASHRSEGALKRYNRRGSVTKYSLDHALASLEGDQESPTKKAGKSSYDPHGDDRSTYSEQLPPRPQFCSSFIDDNHVYYIKK